MTATMNGTRYILNDLPTYTQNPSSTSSQTQDLFAITQISDAPSPSIELYVQNSAGNSSQVIEASTVPPSYVCEGTDALSGSGLGVDDRRANSPAEHTGSPSTSDYSWNTYDLLDASMLTRRSYSHGARYSHQRVVYDGYGRGSGKPPIGVDCCTSCRTTHSPEWRKGPSGRKDLCNA